MSSHTGGPIRIFVVDDTASDLNQIIESIKETDDLECIASATDGQQAVNMVNHVQADVMVLDISMPRLSGIQVAAQVNELNLPMRILANSINQRADYLYSLLASGAHGYLSKRDSKEKLIEAIRKAFQGERPLVNEELCAIVRAEQELTVHEEVEKKISRLELDIMVRIGEGCTNSEIANLYTKSIEDIDTIERKLLKLLGKRSRKKLVSWAWQQGYLDC